MAGRGGRAPRDFQLPWRGARRMGVALALAAGAVLSVVPGLASAQLAPSAPRVLDGPDSALAGNTSLGVAVARDGTGALTYLKGGHLFASSLLGGSFGPPQRIDGALAGPSSQPVVAAASGGLQIVAFINGGALYVVSRPNSFSDWGAPVGLAGGASDPSIQMTYLGKAYLAFTVADGAGHDVRAAYYYQGSWRLESAPLNNIAGDDAGTGSGRPQVAAAGDGVGIVAWGEGGHVFTRRVWGTSSSVVLEQADGPLPGCSEISADSPSIGSGGDSSYAAVGFHELLSCGGNVQSRVLMDRLHASIYDGVAPADGLWTGAADGAGQPGVAVAEYGRGWVTSSRDAGHDLFALWLGSNELPSGVIQLNGEPNSSAPFVVPATAGILSTVIAWQHDPGAGGSRDVRVRYASDLASSLGPELMLSSPGQGTTDAASGLAADGDVAGDAAVAWVQDAGAPQIVVAQLYQPPGAFGALSGFRYSRSAGTVLAWSAPGSWGPMTYTVSVDGVRVGQTGATSFVVGLRDGVHSWQVTATNPGGESRTMAAARVFVDTVAPRASFVLSGQRVAGAVVRIAVKASDSRPGVPASRASGVASVNVSWGDGSPRTRIARAGNHVYRRAGRYKVMVIVQDRAGNTTKLTRRVTITAPPKPNGTAPARTH